MTAASSVRRPALVWATAAVLVFVLAGAGAHRVAAALPPSFPTQSAGDRGTDVLAIQRLFRQAQASSGRTNTRGVTTGARNALIVPVDGVFRASTVAAVRAFQASQMLPETGIVDATTWAGLTVPLGPGATGEAVRAVQAELREKRGAALAVDGVYGASTTAAVASFQAHMGLSQTGAIDAATWRTLVWHFEEPRFSASALCDYDVKNANWGTAEMIATLEAAGASTVAAGVGRIAVGDISLEHGGDIAIHESHEVGLDADLRPMRKSNDQCARGSNWRLTAYDRGATRALVDAIRAAAPGHVKWIFFNDPQLIREGRTTFLTGHDDHLHVHLCEAGHPDRDYRC